MTKVQGDKDSPFTYTGHFWHAQSGLNLTLTRAYDSSLGCWLSRDDAPEGLLLDLVQNSQIVGMSFINRYNYCLNNPIIYVDKDGQLWQLVFVTLVICGIVYAAYSFWVWIDENSDRCLKKWQNPKPTDPTQTPDLLKDAVKTGFEGGGYAGGVEGSLIPSPPVSTGVTTGADWADRIHNWWNNRKNPAPPKPNPNPNP